MDIYESTMTGDKVDALLRSISIYDIASGTDLNDVKQLGYHRIDSGTTFGTLNHTPDNAVSAASVVQVIPFALDNSLVQVLFCYQDSSMFVRKYNPYLNIWTGWCVIIQRESNRKKKGTTSERPTIPSNQAYFYIGDVFFDTTLGKPIWYDGTGWVDSTGASV